MTFQPPPPPPPGGTPPPPGGPTPPPYGEGTPSYGGSTPSYGGSTPSYGGGTPGYGGSTPGYSGGSIPPAPGAPTPPAPGHWGAPSSGSGGFDPKTVNSLDWAILGAGFLVFVFSFFSYYTASVSFEGVHASGHENGWHGFFGWFAVLCALLGAAAVGAELFAPQLKLPIANRLAGLGLFALATLSVIIAWFVTPGTGGTEGLGGVHVSYGRGFGFYADLILIIAGLVLTLMRAQQTNTELPGALNKMPKIGK